MDSRNFLPGGAQPEPSRLADDAFGHIEQVLSIAEGDPAAASDNRVATSWRRSANTYNIDPASRDAPRILTSGELKDMREPLAQLIATGRDEIDHLYSVVREANYTVLFCDNKGVAVDHRGNPADAEQFKYWGTWLGGVWSEDAEGTNGIGTVIVEKRPITIHRSQHFRARNISLSCSGAPIFDADSELVAVLDVSSIDPGLSAQSHALTGALTKVWARAIEERWFRERFRRDWIVAVVPDEGVEAGMLFAVDRDHRIVGADRRARKVLESQHHRTSDGLSLWAVFEPAFAIFRHTGRGDVAAPLTPIGTSDTWPALVTPPEASGSWRNSEVARLHARPRLDVIGHFQPLEPALPARGGLSPAALRRVKDYIDGNLDKSIDIATLAEIAGLSVFHFARAFKQSEGATPHGYLLERRLERARKLLTTTNLTHAEIAFATGLSDASHLARLFRQHLGVSPSTFKLSRR